MAQYIPTIGSLFAGIGGFDLGFERAGFKTAWQVEIDPYCLKILEKNFPHAQRFEDIRNCGKHNLAPVDVICGGFPCQDISNAGKRAGIDGERSGLWGEMHRTVSELRPHIVVVENVAALLGRGIGRVVGDLAEIGYDAEWRIISAADVGAPHLRERVWIVAYPNCGGCSEPDVFGQQPWGAKTVSDGKALAHASGQGLSERVMLRGVPVNANRAGQGQAAFLGSPVSDTAGGSGQSSSTQSDEWRFQNQALRSVGYSHDWSVEPNVGRVAHGVPARVDRLKGLGNAIVPQIAELIATRLLQVFDFGGAL